MTWPPLSADLTPMDFFPWGHIEAVIYKSPFDSEEEFTAHIFEAAATWHFRAHTTISAASSAYIHCAYSAYILLQVCMSVSGIVIHNIE